MWIKAENWFNRITYIILALTVLHTANYFDFQLFSFSASYVVEFNTLSETLLGMVIIAVFGINALIWSLSF